MMMKVPELLCPAGNMESLRAALHFGADAVYGGMKRFGLRAFAGNFDEEQLREAVRLVHGAGKKFYLTMNVFPFDDQMADFVETARIAREIGVDAAIVSDIGAIVTLREQVPDLPLHVSTQASTVNAAAVKHYQALGCQRVILAREVSLERLRAMQAQLDGAMELETFVHGASCVAYSGRCLLSAVLAGRSGNQGACAQPCRWQYAVVEQKRPGEYLPVCEDTNGTYIFSARDLNLMPLLPELVSAGVSSLKIEGRMKTEYYVAVVTGAYRRALDLLARGEDAFRAALPELMAELACASHRESDTGFALEKPRQPGGAEGFHQEREYIARVMAPSAAGEPAWLMLKNRFHAGDTLEVMTAGGVAAVEAKPFLREKTGETLDTLGIAGEMIRMELPISVAEGDLIRGQVRNHRK
ncbi:MAG: U32 family peptidase [Clostridiales bacterium]|nr:U32 family peptidase [Clostridiales bacterium]